VYTRNVDTTFLTTLLQQILSSRNICIRICILVIKFSTYPYFATLLNIKHDLMLLDRLFIHYRSLELIVEIHFL